MKDQIQTNVERHLVRAGTMLASRSFHKEDRLEISLENSKIKIMIQQGLVDKVRSALVM